MLSSHTVTFTALRMIWMIFPWKNVDACSQLFFKFWWKATY